MLGRRTVLRGLGGIAIAPMFMQSVAAREAADSDTIIVAILLAGGNDGLNTVVPLKNYGQYYSLRTPATPPPGLALAYTLSDLSATAFDTNPATPPNQATEFAFAPGMTDMRTLYATGKLAVIAGVGLPPQEQNALSHLNGQLDWMTGQINVGAVPPNGWLGLTLDHANGGKLGTSSSLSGTTPLLSGATTQGLVINPPMDYFGTTYGITDQWTKLHVAYHNMLALPASTQPGAYDQAVLQAASADQSTVHTIARKRPASGYQLNTWLDYQLRDIGRLIAGKSGIRGFFASQGSYDTHASQAQYQPQLLQQLSFSLSQFYAYLQAEGASKNVVIMTMSDFGRRPAANLDFGTDHGGATVSFVLGDLVKGGVYGQYPSLTKFDANDNLKMNVDFRNVLSDLIVAMGGNPTPILGETWPSLGFV